MIDSVAIHCRGEDGNFNSESSDQWKNSHWFVMLTGSASSYTERKCVSMNKCLMRSIQRVTLSTN